MSSYKGTNPMDRGSILMTIASGIRTSTLQCGGGGHKTQLTTQAKTASHSRSENTRYSLS